MWVYTPIELDVIISGIESNVSNVNHIGSKKRKLNSFSVTKQSSMVHQNDESSNQQFFDENNTCDEWTNLYYNK